MLTIPVRIESGIALSVFTFTMGDYCMSLSLSLSLSLCVSVCMCVCVWSYIGCAYHIHFLILSSLADNACNKIQCQNNGTCFKGVCSCVDGSTGTLCQEIACESYLCYSPGSLF